MGQIIMRHDTHANMQSSEAFTAFLCKNVFQLSVATPEEISKSIKHSGNN